MTFQRHPKTTFIMELPYSLGDQLIILIEEFYLFFIHRSKVINILQAMSIYIYVYIYIYTYIYNIF